MDKARFEFRPATHEDIPGMTECFFRSFNAPFWLYLFPDNAYTRQWWHDAFTLSLDNPTDRSFVVVDTQQQDDGGKIAAFSRWMVPQDDGNQARRWPAMDPAQFDMDVVGAFFGGMEANRVEVMGRRPHWFLELLATHEDYQKQGLASEQIRWGTDQADRDGLETYLDASEKGQPFYYAHHNFKHAKDIPIPDRPAYGSFRYVSVVRQPQKAATVSESS